MKLLLFLLLILSANLFAQLTPSWSREFIGPIYQIKSVDIDNDQKNEIVASGESGLIAIDDDNSLLWHVYTGSAEKLIPLQYDSDANLEFAVVSWLDIKIFDDDGTRLLWTMYTNWSSQKLPFAILDDRLVSYYTYSSGSESNGLMFADEYSPFYYLPYAPTNSLVGVDSDNDGKNDLLFGINNYQTLFKLDKNGNELATVDLGYSSAVYLWGGLSQNSQVMLLVGTYDGEIHALDINGNELWSQTLSSTNVVKIKKDSLGGFLVVTNNDSGWTDGTINVVSKIDENNGSILWQYSSGSEITKAIAQRDDMIAAGFEAGFKVFDQNGTITHEANISQEHSGYYLDVHALRFGTLGYLDGLFVGTLDIDLFNDTLHKKIYSGGTLVHKIATGDMNGDGKDEIAVEDEQRVYLYDSNGTLLWVKDRYHIFNDYNFADLDGDGNNELLVGYDGKLAPLNYNGDELWSNTGYYSNIYPAIDLFDYDGDGLKDLFSAGLDYDTQKYILHIWSGKTGAVLSEISTDISSMSTIKVIDIHGDKKLFYDDYGYMYYIDLNDTTASPHYTNFSLSYEHKLNEYKDLNGDGVVDIVTASNSGSDSLTIKKIDLTQTDEFGQLSPASSATITSPDYAKMIKLFDYNSDGTYEVLVVYEKEVALYDFSGNKIWSKGITDEYGDTRMLSDVKVVDNVLVVAGKEIDILDNNGVLLQKLSPPNYMSSTNYYLPTALAKTSAQDLQLVFGAMGIFSYTGVQIDTSALPTLSYKAGWNLVAVPVNQTVPLSNIDGLAIAWEYNNGRWNVHTTNEVDYQAAHDFNFPQFDAIVPTRGVWIKSSLAGTITLFSEANSLATLHQGWNLIGGVAITPTALHSLNQNIDLVWKYTNQDTWEGKSFIEGISLDTLTDIQAHEGFWVYVK